MLVENGNVNTALNALKKKLVEGGLWTVINNRKTSPLYNAMSHSQKRRRKDALAHRRRMKALSRRRRRAVEEDD